MLRQEIGRSTPSSHPDESHTGNNGFPGGPIDDAWVHNLVVGWMKQYVEPRIGSEELELFRLFQGRILDQFLDAYDRRVDELTKKGKLPALEPDEMYPTEYIPILGQAYEEAEAEVGWCPMNQAKSKARK